ncbi:RlmE family RNA methyltransferase [Methanobrevibacter filiformis]|uniref:Ribosomal RNA large subunit methyltransferase E n=1 Tax=Methanobrevibacter filiformis TaxID=55758 RepID=A0A165ZPQ3_9EURY|nr:SAM-dependent methyltransferase [Methanobrevibacter filiformis]KZX10998.1 ribosomal RNA large subunit methyltransferase E [Methanobrevibacter filiformis]
MGSRWQVEKKRDPYYKRAKNEDYRSRASYKLLQLNKKFKIIKKGNKVLDLGAAPGGWSQVALERVEEDGMILAVDLQRMKPFTEENFHSIRGDFTTPEIQEAISSKLEGKANAIISDASPSLTGIKNLDHLKSMDLFENVMDICYNHLAVNGNILIKFFQGEKAQELIKANKKKFRTFKTTKPASSRKKSSEMYLLGLGYKL